MSEKSGAALREEWIDAFVKHVVSLAPKAPAGPLAAKAERLYPHLGRFGPIEVAEAEWEDLPLGGEPSNLVGTRVKPRAEAG